MNWDVASNPLPLFVPDSIISTRVLIQEFIIPIDDNVKKKCVWEEGRAVNKKYDESHYVLIF